MVTNAIYDVVRLRPKHGGRLAKHCGTGHIVVSLREAGCCARLGPLSDTVSATLLPQVASSAAEHPAPAWATRFSFVDSQACFQLATISRLENADHTTYKRSGQEREGAPPPPPPLRLPPRPRMNSPPTIARCAALCFSPPCPQVGCDASCLRQISILLKDLLAADSMAYHNAHVVLVVPQEPTLAWEALLCLQPSSAVSYLNGDLRYGVCVFVCVVCVFCRARTARQATRLLLVSPHTRRDCRSKLPGNLPAQR